MHRQVNVLKTRRMAEMKAEGMEYDERIEELDKVDYPKPEEELLYNTFQTFSQHLRVCG